VKLSTEREHGALPPFRPLFPPDPARRRDPSELFLPAFRAPSGCAGTPRQTARWPSKRLNRH